MRVWSLADIEKVRQVLPSIKNGRKTRYEKHRAKQKSAAPKLRKKGKKTD